MMMAENVSSIRGVIFDYGNVIARVDNERFLQRLAARSALPFADIERIIYHDPNISREYESGRMTSIQFYEEVANRCGVSMTFEEFRLAFTHIFERIPETLDLIRALKSRHKLGLLSNTNPMDFEAEIVTVPVFPLFDAVTVSFAAGVMKPDAAIYRDILTKLDLAPHHCVYIDDIPAYVEGARRVGLHAIHYTSHDDVTSELHAFGVVPDPVLD